jgi:hypothetical protein
MRTMLSFIGLTAALISAPASQAQPQQTPAPLTFEVATVKPLGQVTGGFAA